MIPWATLLRIDRQAGQAVYLQIANQIVKEIRSGILKPGLKLPSTRQLSELLGVHRKTIVQAYDELDAQGWLDIRPNRGAFISGQLPETQPVKISSRAPQSTPLDETGFAIRNSLEIRAPVKTFREMTGFHDGPDVRLVPVRQIGRAYQSILRRKTSLHQLSYVDVEGRPVLKKVFSEDMNMLRGMQTTPDQIFITRGSQMGLFMVAQVLFSKNDLVIVGEIDFYYACQAFEFAGAKIVRVSLDEAGLDVDAIETLCRTTTIRAVYVTSHHHFPTTVTLSAARRMKLLSLAEEYGFVIIEDDYDYDFHYETNPILPVASADRKGMVVYLGTLSKTIAPAIRIGYVVAPRNLIAELAKLRQIIDIQGDPVMEQAIAELYREGEIRRHMKKALKEYRERRDLLCALLSERLGDCIEFKKPEGGLAIWAKYDPKIELPQLSATLRAKGLVLSPGLVHNPSEDIRLNCTRMGFGWMNQAEIEQAVRMLEEEIRRDRN